MFGKACYHKFLIRYYLIEQHIFCILLMIDSLSFIDVVTNITFTVNGDTSAQVTWSPPGTTNGIITNYTISIGVVGSGMMPNKTTILGNRARIQTFNALSEF